MRGRHNVCLFCIFIPISDHLRYFCSEGGALSYRRRLRRRTERKEHGTTNKEQIRNRISYEVRIFVTVVE